MSSLRLLMANYSDSEDDSPSSEGKRKKIKRSNDTEIKELNEDKRDLQTESSEDENKDYELNKDKESLNKNSESTSPKAPLNDPELKKRTEQSSNLINQEDNYKGNQF